MNEHYNTPRRKVSRQPQLPGPYTLMASWQDHQLMAAAELFLHPDTNTWSIRVNAWGSLKRYSYDTEDAARADFKLTFDHPGKWPTEIVAGGDA